VPSPAVQGFTSNNTWHAALPDPDADGGHATELEAEILQVCSDDCADGAATVWGRLVNRSDRAVPAGISLALYSVTSGTRALLDVQTTEAPVPPGFTSDPIAFTAPKGPATERNDSIELVPDDDGAGVGAVLECTEGDATVLDGALCP
jgi:hypothetical protein